MVLAGEPRAIDTVVIVATMFFVWTAWRDARPVGPYLAAVAVALVPRRCSCRPMVTGGHGREHLAAGQRYLRPLRVGVPALALAGPGLRPRRPRRQPVLRHLRWLAGYNLPEVMSYVGLLPVVGACALLGTWRRRGRLPDWLIWHLVAVVGVVLALGSFTPLGHLLVHVPLFGGQRLQSRNIALTDLALAVLLSYWVDHVLDRRRRGEGRAVPPSRFGRVEVAALVPLAATALLAAVAAIDPVAVARFVGADAQRAAGAVAQRPLVIVSLVLAAVLALMVVRSGRTKPVTFVRFLVLFCLADLIFFNLSSVWTVAPTLGITAPAAEPAFPSGTAPVPLRGAEPIGKTGRFVIDDQSSAGQALLRRLGQPDLNLYRHSFSAQGYSSIVDGPYAAATGSHEADGRGTNVLGAGGPRRRRPRCPRHHHAGDIARRPGGAGVVAGNVPHRPPGGGRRGDGPLGFR